MTDTMKIWDAVSKTDPKNTKKVNQRGGFTAIDAHSQIEAATRQFGPIGEGWGYNAGEPIFHDNLVFIQVTLWHGEFGKSYGPMTGGSEWKDKNGRLDSDAIKKATTDAVTKLLSQLGFNADVFLRKFDDNKYVQQMEREFAEKEKASVPKISEDQRTELMALCSGLDVAIGGLLKAAGLKDARDIPASDFERSKAWINRKAEQQKAEKENTDA